jgi:uncharacterized protein
VALTHHERLAGTGRGRARERRPDASRWLVPGAAVCAGAGSAYLVGHDGQIAWRLLRILLVAIVTLAVTLVLRRNRDPGRPALAFGIGLLALPVGLGIALPFAAEEGMHAMTIAGALSLLGGAFLVAAGGYGVVRHARGWRRIAVVPVMALALVATCLTLGMAVAATNVPPTEVGSLTPADAGLPYRDVVFATSDAVRLSGWYIPSTNGAAVAVMHGAGSTRSAVLEHAVVLARHGYGVLLFDARGHGRSEGRAMDFGWYGDEDISSAISFLQAQPGVERDRIAAVGMSMGGEEAIGAAAADPRIRAVVAEGATTRVSGDRAWLSDQYGWRGSLQEGLEWMQYSIADLLTSADPPMKLRDAVRATAPRPVLLIAGGSGADEPLADRFIQGGSPATVALWVVPDTGHIGALNTHPAAWEQRVVAFLAKAIGS